jgi:hypothetical protein
MLINRSLDAKSYLGRTFVQENERTFRSRKKKQETTKTRLNRRRGDDVALVHPLHRLSSQGEEEEDRKELKAY